MVVLPLLVLHLQPLLHPFNCCIDSIKTSWNFLICSFLKYTCEYKWSLIFSLIESLNSEQRTYPARDSKICFLVPSNFETTFHFSQSVLVAATPSSWPSSSWLDHQLTDFSFIIIFSFLPSIILSSFTSFVFSPWKIIGYHLLLEQHNSVRVAISLLACFAFKCSAHITLLKSNIHPDIALSESIQVEKALLLESTWK